MSESEYSCYLQLVARLSKVPADSVPRQKRTQKLDLCKFMVRLFECDRDGDELSEDEVAEHMALLQTVLAFAEGREPAPAADRPAPPSGRQNPSSKPAKLMALPPRPVRQRILSVWEAWGDVWADDVMVGGSRM